MHRINLQDISDRFAEILSNSPHRIPYSLFLKTEPVNNDAGRNFSVKKRWHRFFEQSLSELKLAAYGQDPTMENSSQFRPS
jgi:hypothetical protein